MASENKTKPTDDDVEAFLAGVEPPRRREDSLAVLELMKRVTGWEPRMWGPSIVGFGQYHYRYDSGREGDSLRVGFSPRKASLVLYVMPGFGRYEDLMSRLGKHKTGKSCLYVNKLADVDLAVLEQLVVASLEHMAAKYPQGA